MEVTIERKLRMKKKSLLIKIILGIAILTIILLPFIKPLKIEGHFIPYNYTVHGTYVEINKYTGGEYEVEIPAYIWFKPVRKIETGAFEETYFLYIRKFLLRRNSGSK